MFTESSTIPVYYKKRKKTYDKSKNRRNRKAGGIEKAVIRAGGRKTEGIKNQEAKQGHRRNKMTGRILNSKRSCGCL